MIQYMNNRMLKHQQSTRNSGKHLGGKLPPILQGNLVLLSDRLKGHMNIQYKFKCKQFVVIQLNSDPIA